jgi:hypothetical protein
MSTLRPSPFGFRFDQLIGQADGLGAALSADSAPNAVAPPADRVFSTTSAGKSIESGFVIAALDGTSIDAQPWGKVLLSDSVSLWIPLASKQTVTYGAQPTYYIVGPFGGVSAFVQLSANVGNVRRVGWSFA